MIHRVQLSALGLLAVSLASCETTEIFRGNPDEEPAAKGDYIESASPLTGSELDALWERSEMVLGMEGFGIDRSRTSYADRQMVTHWNTELAPNRFEGRRKRAWVRMRSPAAGAWILGVAVQVQRNVDIDQPSNLSQAQWEDIEGDASRASTILWKLESGLRAPASDDSK